jgi:hypothetical protein
MYILWIYLHIHSFKNTTICQMLSLCNIQHYIIYKYMFRPCNWTIIRLFIEWVSWLYHRSLGGKKSRLTYIYTQSKNTTICQMVSLCNIQHYIIYNYMFRPCNWAIIRLFVEPVSWLYRRSLRGGGTGSLLTSYLVGSV